MGTLIKGIWGIDKNIITLTPKNPDAPFYLYARKNPDIKGGMRLMISGNDSANDIYVGTFPNKMKRLLMKMQIVLTILTYIIRKNFPKY